MIDYTVFQSIDWLQYTSKKRIEELGIDYVETWEVSKTGMNGYEFKGVDNETGVVALWSDKRPQMGTHVIMSGDVCQWYRGVGMTDIELVKSAMDRGRLSRIDIAITSHPNDYEKPHEFGAVEQQILWDNNRVDTRMTGNDGYMNDGTQRTFYLGKGKKGNKYRGYDKGNEHYGGIDWLQRYELQSRKKTANTIGRMVVDGVDFGEIMNRYIKFDSPLWDGIVGAEKGTIEHLPEKVEKDTIGWLRDVCAPALARVADEGRDPLAIIEWFNHVVIQNMDSENLAYRQWLIDNARK